MSWHSLPLFVRLEGCPVILLGEGGAADAKRRLLERAGAAVVGEESDAALAIVAIDDPEAAEAAVARLKARRILVNAVDRPALCDFTLPAIVDRDPVLVAIGTGGASAGLAAALRQRLEAVLPTGLGSLAKALSNARAGLRARFPESGARRRALADVLAAGGALDPLQSRAGDPVTDWLAGISSTPVPVLHSIILASPDPDDLTLRQARLLASADRVTYRRGVPTAILDRARADAMREQRDVCPGGAPAGLWLDIAMAVK